VQLAHALNLLVPHTTIELHHTCASVRVDTTHSGLTPSHMHIVDPVVESEQMAVHLNRVKI
jgi:hypothetical protein